MNWFLLAFFSMTTALFAPPPPKPVSQAELNRTVRAECFQMAGHHYDRIGRRSSLPEIKAKSIKDIEPRAVAVCQEAVAAAPSPAVRVALARALVATGDLEQAAAQLTDEIVVRSGAAAGTRWYISLEFPERVGRTPDAVFQYFFKNAPAAVNVQGVFRHDRLSRDARVRIADDFARAAPQKPFLWRYALDYLGGSLATEEQFARGMEWARAAKASGGQAKDATVDRFVSSAQQYLVRRYKTDLFVRMLDTVPPKELSAASLFRFGEFFRKQKEPDNARMRKYFGEAYRRGNKSAAHWYASALGTHAATVSDPQQAKKLYDEALNAVRRSENFRKKRLQDQLMASRQQVIAKIAALTARPQADRRNNAAAERKRPQRTPRAMTSRVTISDVRAAVRAGQPFMITQKVNMFVTGLAMNIRQCESMPRVMRIRLMTIGATGVLDLFRNPGGADAGEVIGRFVLGAITKGMETRAGGDFGNSIACGTPANRAARSIIQAIDFTQGGGGKTQFVNTCAGDSHMNEIKCRCLQSALRSTKPDIGRSAYNQVDLNQLFRQAPMVVPFAMLCINPK